MDIHRLHVVKTVYAVKFESTGCINAIAKFLISKSFVNAFDPYQNLVF